MRVEAFIKRSDGTEELYYTKDANGAEHWTGALSDEDRRALSSRIVCAFLQARYPGYRFELRPQKRSA